MNTVSNAISKTAYGAVTRRFASTATFKGAVPPKKKYSFKDAWLSDPSTYPIMVVMGCAMTFMVGMSANALFFYKGVYVDPKKRRAKMVTWGDTENKTVVGSLLDKFHIEKYSPEGLGVDHEEWKRQKEAYRLEDQAGHLRK